jgi:hypothetical protein
MDISMNKKSMIKFLRYWQNSEWVMMENMLAENFECEVIWSGFKFNKEDFIPFIKTTTDDVIPWVAKFEITNEIQFGNYTVTQFFRPAHGDDEKNFELLIVEWSGDKIEKINAYNIPKSDAKVSENWIHSIQKE